MLSGKELILATKPYAYEIRSKSWYYTISTLLLLIAAVTGAMLLPQLWLRIPCSIFAGLFMARAFVIYHDHQHHAILHGSKAGNVIMTIYGIYTLAPTSIWKRSHDHHHKHNSKLYSASIGSYPIMTAQKFNGTCRSGQRAYLATRHPITIILGYFSMFIVGMCVNSFRSSPRRHIDSLLAIIVHVVYSVAVWYFIGWQAWLLGILVPFLMATGMGAYLFYVQHNFPGVNFADNKNWKYEVAALQSSSYLKMSPFMNWVTGNIGYHHIHHLNSRIPFYRLPEAMAAVPELQQCRTTTLSFKDIRAAFDLKVWDEEARQMVNHKKMQQTA